MSTSEPLDPKRPWLTDPDDLSASNPLWKTILIPFGTSSQVPFTRAWTFCFFARLLTLLLGYLLSQVLAVVFGIESATPVFLFLFVLVFVLTLGFSFVSHVRRLADAGKPTILAGLVLAPLILGGAMFTYQASKNVKVANGITAMMHLGKTAEKIESNQSANSGNRARPRGGQTARGPGRNSRRGRRGRGGQQGDNPQEYNPTMMVVFMSIFPAIGVWFLTATGVFFWSLMWVARLPRSKEVDLSETPVVRGPYSR